MMNQLTQAKGDLNQGITRLKAIEQEKLIKEMHAKEEYKSLMEIDEKVKKDADRKHKMEEELKTLESNLKREKENKRQLEEDKQKISEHIGELHKTASERDQEREKIADAIKSLKKNIQNTQLEW